MKKERLIKRMVIALSLSTALIGGSIAASTAIDARRVDFGYQKTIDKLNEEVVAVVEEKNNLLDEYENSNHYQEKYDAKKKSLITDLVDGKITGQDYENKLNILNSNKFTQEVLESSTNEEKKVQMQELENDVANLQDKINYVKDKKEAHIKDKAIVVALSGTMGAMLPYTMFIAHCIKGSVNKKEREKEDLTK